MVASVLAGMLGRAPTCRSVQEKAPIGQAKGVRRIVTGHNASGKAVILCEQVAASPWLGRAVTETLLWRTERVPADNASNSESAASAAGSATLSGSAFRIVELAPECTTPARHEPAIDYCMPLSGEVELIIEDGKAITLSTGDTAVLRGTRQAWRNLSRDTPCKIAVCSIEAWPTSIANKLPGAAE